MPVFIMFSVLEHLARKCNKKRLVLDKMADLLLAMICWMETHSTMEVKVLRIDMQT
jgi:hypothetical protein